MPLPQAEQGQTSGEHAQDNAEQGTAVTGLWQGNLPPTACWLGNGYCLVSLDGGCLGCKPNGSWLYTSHLYC